MLLRLPIFLLGCVIAAYWARVMRMAGKQRRKTGRAANLVPSESLGRWLRLVWTPVIVVWVAHPFMSAFWRQAPMALRPIYSSVWTAWPGVVIAGLCLLLSRMCWKIMGKDWRMGIDPTERNPLIATGPFARVRHPIYSLSCLMMLASMTVIPSPVMLCVGVAHIGLLMWEARREEAHLLKIHGQAYSDYCRTVGRFIPRLATVRL